MRYVVVFQVNMDNSGKATYVASMSGGVSPPYQKPIGDNRCQQEFTFSNSKAVSNFIKKAFDEFGADFEVMHIYNFKETK